MNVIGHRGCAAEFPENTLAAVQGSAPRVDMVEIDVRQCRSGELVVFHDERVDRLTDQTGRVSTFDYDTLSTLTVGDSEESIPTLADALEKLPEGTGVNIELKEAGIAGRTLNLIEPIPNEIIISSFDPQVLNPVQNAAVSTAFLCMDATNDAVKTAVELDCAHLHPQYSTVDAEFVERAHDCGLSVNAWTVPSETAVRQLQANDIDGVIVDSWTTIPKR